MRRFFTFVVRDDVPPVTPPSEDEAQVSGAVLDPDIPPVLPSKHIASDAYLTHPVNSTHLPPHSGAALSNGLCSVHAHSEKESESSVLGVSSLSDSELYRKEHPLSFHQGIRVEEQHSSDQSSYQVGSVDNQQDCSEMSFSELPIPIELRLRKVVSVLSAFAENGPLLETNRADIQISLDHVLIALKDLAEIMVWADQNDPAVWDIFMELGIMPLILRCLHATTPPSVEENGVERNTGDRRGPNCPHDVQGKTEQSVILAKKFDSSLLSSESRNEYIESGLHQRDENPVKSPAVCDVGREPGYGGFLMHSSSVKPLQVEEALSNGGEQSSVALSEVSDGKGIEPDLEDDDATILEATMIISRQIQSQVLQTLSIIIQSVSRKESLLCLFSANHINSILSFQFSFKDDELIGYFVSVIKTISLKLDRSLLQLFFDPINESFPLYSSVTCFLDHPESMVRIAVRNITLSIYAIGDDKMLRYAAKDESKYFFRTVELLSKLCGSVARAFELLLDDGREIQRTRSRTGLLRRKVRKHDVSDKLEEIEDLFMYFSDVGSVSEAYLFPSISRLLAVRLFSPFFRPLASQASPQAMRILWRKWRISTSEPGINDSAALAPFDAAARCLLLTIALSILKCSKLGKTLCDELCRQTRELERRHVLHALKAMAADINGTERVTFVSLCAIEAFITCKAANKEMLSRFKYDFNHDDFGGRRKEDIENSRRSFIDIGMPGRDDLEHGMEKPLLMALSEFEAPLTPSNSSPNTPRLFSRSSFEQVTAPKFLSRASSNVSISSDSGIGIERADNDAFITAFQLGDASLKETITSIILMVRRREVRTERVLHSLSRIICGVGREGNSFNVCVDITKSVLDELAGGLRTCMRNKRTTIVSIETIFENFRTFVEEKPEMYTKITDLAGIVSANRIPNIACELPVGAGKRRRGFQHEMTAPLEVEDARTFFVMLYTYEQSLTSAGVVNSLPSLSYEVGTILMEYGLEDTYLDKREALENLAEAVLRHGVIEKVG